MSPQEELSAKDIMLMFLDKATYEKRHEELQSRMSILENKFDSHLAWANQTLQIERKTTNEQFAEVHKAISGKLEALNVKMDKQAGAKIERRLSIALAVLSPVLLVALEYFVLRR